MWRMKLYFRRIQHEECYHTHSPNTGNNVTFWTDLYLAQSSNTKNKNVGIHRVGRLKHSSRQLHTKNETKLIRRARKIASNLNVSANFEFVFERIRVWAGSAAESVLLSPGRSMAGLGLARDICPLSYTLALLSLLQCLGGPDTLPTLCPGQCAPRKDMGKSRKFACRWTEFLAACQFRV